MNVCMFCVFVCFIGLSSACLSVCSLIHLSLCQFSCLRPCFLSPSQSVRPSMSLSLSASPSLPLSTHLCVYLAYGADPACSPRFMKCEQLSRWCVSYSARLCVGFVPQTKAYDTCEPLVAQTRRRRGSSGC